MSGENDEGYQRGMDGGCPGRRAGPAAMPFPGAAVPALRTKGPPCGATPPAPEDALPGGTGNRPGPARSGEVFGFFLGGGGGGVG